MISTKEERPVLHSIEVKNLFGSYDYFLDLAFPKSSRTTIIFGRNGTGKTTLLRLLRAISEVDLGFLQTVSFDNLSLDFDKAVLTITRDNNAVDAMDDASSLCDIVVQFTLTDPKWTLQGWPESEKWPPGPEWRFPGEQISGMVESQERSTKASFQDVLERYLSDRSQTDKSSLLKLDSYKTRTPQTSLPRRIVVGRKEIRTLLDNLGLRCKLITAQRLRKEVRAEGDNLSVIVHSQDVAQQIHRTFLRYSRIGDSRSETFPRRVMREVGQATTPKALSDELYRLEQSRKELVKLGILPQRGKDTSQVQPISSKPMDDDSFLAVFLRTYIDDEYSKIAEYDALRVKAKRFVEFVNNHLHRKQLSIDFEKSRMTQQGVTESDGAFVIKDQQERVIPLQKLSSGEQHLITWSYELVFKSGKFDIIMIDEPELSMHVEWQLDFVNSIEDISEGSNLQFILATHSPAIVNSCWDITARLEQEEAT